MLDWRKQKIDEAELREWAESRADDAGRLARQLLGQREALDWAIAEIEGRTRYDREEQRENALERAKQSL